ncbi:hypothetical protein [Nocardia transvalensis]|uniref:hypothetical protein n=1 Tax=Nocardia transvalensis TaxID=37333 RepID=UPI0018944327|nr:hypothetical protein [Nocardia transvalensis]MBF6332234.1 hypothetical protein [Nocardia transvalensis]
MIKAARVVVVTLAVVVILVWAACWLGGSAHADQPVRASPLIPASGLHARDLTAIPTSERLLLFAGGLVLPVLAPHANAAEQSLTHSCPSISSSESSGSIAVAIEASRSMELSMP